LGEALYSLIKQAGGFWSLCKTAPYICAEDVTERKLTRANSMRQRLPGRSLIIAEG